MGADNAEVHAAAEVAAMSAEVPSSPEQPQVPDDELGEPPHLKIPDTSEVDVSWVVVESAADAGDEGIEYGDI
jgi:hypothetical protein